MRIDVTTEVPGPVEEVFQGFDRALFLKLNPPFPLVRLLRFDGCETGDEVHLALNFILFRQRWESVITDAGQDAAGRYFVDEGRMLPWPLKTWRHHHGLERSGSGTRIRDRIDFSTGNRFLDRLMYPALYLQFLYRKPVYRSFFSRKNG